jgi:hypothetical protein
MAHISVCHGDAEGRGCKLHVALDRFPDVQNLPAAERAKVVDAFEQNAVLQAFSDRAGSYLMRSDNSSVVR